MSFPGVTPTSMVLATLQTVAKGIGVAAAVPDTDSFTLKLTKKPKIDVVVAWFVLGIRRGIRRAGGGRLDVDHRRLVDPRTRRSRPSPRNAAMQMVRSRISASVKASRSRSKKASSMARWSTANRSA